MTPAHDRTRTVTIPRYYWKHAPAQMMADLDQWPCSTDPEGARSWHIPEQQVILLCLRWPVISLHAGGQE